MLGKQEAAARLIKAAITAQIRGDDPLPLHLIVFSAIRVLSDLRKARELPPLIFGHHLQPGRVRDFMARFYEINNFLKHADRDPDGMISIDEIAGLNDLGLILAVESLGSLGFDIQQEFWMVYFRAKFVLQNPECLDPSTPPEWVESVTRIWHDLGSEAVVELARNPNAYHGQFEAMTRQLAIEMRL